ncbi:dihydroneopterin aldolase [Streptococcus pseudoporcinus]|uniref:7,8-dihydroneopterin aldolase n=1 Tax=Streptococcus pseudoporcinus TaxID=361101 RepID=A0A4U9YJH2_9STRE|nr:dihydroneopterin aldolase [Streptococcus pseudoporcinus]VTS26755.1 dihydroneopterin aldolase [Streptococcus pseudoporcinus]
MDKIRLNGCRFYGYHGALAEEQVLGQVFVIDLELAVDLVSASKTDNLEETVHYGHVFERVKALVESQRFALIERLGGAICEELFQEFPTIEGITISIRKENPPIAGHYDSVGIILERRR